MKKDEEYEESHKLKNMIRGLDDEEAGFLENIDKARNEIEERKRREEADAIAEFKKTILELSSEEKEKKIQEFKRSLWSSSSRNENSRKMSESESSSNSSSKKSSQALLAGAVKRKINVLESSCEKDEEEDSSSKRPLKCGDPKTGGGDVDAVETIKCIGILPGIGVYGSDSSDSENSSDSDDGVGDDLGGEATLISRAQRTKNKQ